MSHFNRNYIDKHWFIFFIRGILASIFGILLLSGKIADVATAITAISTYLLAMGIIDASSALYNSTKKRGWLNSVMDASIDIIAAIILLFALNENIILGITTIAVYTLISGFIDIIHSFRSTTDPTDKFIRVIAGMCGMIVAFPICNTGEQDISIFAKIFAAYSLIVGVCSLIYGAHNRAQSIEDKELRKEAAKKASATRAAKKSTTKQRSKKTK